MIKSVTIKNYILIDELTLEFDKGFNVFTGETGAGKSIIIGAIDTALGAKVNKDVIKTGCDKAFIELIIKLNENINTDIFIQAGIEITGNELVISREILPNITRSRINGVMVSQEYMKEIREVLADIHTQHQSYNYVQQKNHILLLDNFALKPHKDNINIFKEKYYKYIKLKQKLEADQKQIEAIKEKEDFIKFQIKEIEEAKIEDVNECENLEKELDILSNSEKLKELSYSSYWAIYGENDNIIDALSSIKSNITKLSNLDDSLNELAENFNNIYENLKETANVLREYSESKENNSQRMDEIGERLSFLEKIKRKYGSSLDLVVNQYNKLCEELNSIEFSQEEIINTQKELDEVSKELNTSSDMISKTRKELAKILSEAVTQELEKLELAKSRFEIDITPCEMNEKGTDRVEFLISTNISEDVKPLIKTASGGEISRIMLAIKTIFAKADSTNTVIFDEIDTGISGKASQKVADELSNLSKTHQVILITHQPLIAAKADTHFYVKKEQTDKTKVNVYKLENENRIKAIALLAAGEINNDSTAFAKNLLGV